MNGGTVLVTGTSSGIGRACAVELAGRGFHVLAGVRNEADAEAVRALHPGPDRAADARRHRRATRSRGCPSASAARWRGWSTTPGFAEPGPVEYVAVEEIRRQIEVMLVAPFVLTHTLLPALRAARGRVVNIGSIGGRVGLPFNSPYNAAKAGIASMSDSLRQELGPVGVHVALVEPGSIATDIWERGLAAGDELLESLPEAGRRLYGERLDHLRKAAEMMAKRGVPPAKVAEVVAHALTADRPAHALPRRRRRARPGAAARGAARPGARRGHRPRVRRALSDDLLRSSAMAEVSRARYRAGSGEPVVLLHGFTATWRCWLPVLPDLVARYDVFAPTLTGHDGGPPVEPGQDPLAPRPRPSTSSASSTRPASTPRTSSATRWAARSRSSSPRRAARAASSGCRPAAAGTTATPRGRGSRSSSAASSKLTRATKKNVDKVMKSPVAPPARAARHRPVRRAARAGRGGRDGALVAGVHGRRGRLRGDPQRRGAAARPRPGPRPDARRLGRVRPRAADAARHAARFQRRDPRT